MAIRRMRGPDQLVLLRHYPILPPSSSAQAFAGNDAVRLESMRCPQTPAPRRLLVLDRDEPAGTGLVVGSQVQTGGDFLGVAPTLEQPARGHEDRERGLDLAAAVLDDLPRHLFDGIRSFGHPNPHCSPAVPAAHVRLPAAESRGAVASEVAGCQCAPAAGDTGAGRFITRAATASPAKAMVSSRNTSAKAITVACWWTNWVSCFSAIADASLP